MPSISVPGALLGGALIGGAGSIAGGLISAGGAKSAANAQLQGIDQGLVLQQLNKQQLQGMLQPYMDTGQSGLNQLKDNIGGLTKPFNPTMADLEATPGYQFTLNQGQQAVANSYSGQGLGAGVTKGATAMTPSGPGAKGAINYAENLASQTYQQQFSNYLGQNSQLYSMMMGQANLGESAAGVYGGVATNATNAQSGLSSAGGAAVANGIQSGANALGQGITGATSGISNFALLNSLGGGSLFGGGNSGAVTDSTFNGLTDSQVMGN